MFFRGIICVRCGHHFKYIDALLVQNAEFVNVKVSVMCAYECSFMIAFQTNRLTCTTSDFEKDSCVLVRCRIPTHKLLEQCSKTFLLADPFWLRKIITDPHILAQVNIVSGWQVFIYQN
jgi:hypothetical protein